METALGSNRRSETVLGSQLGSEIALKAIVRLNRDRTSPLLPSGDRPTRLTRNRSRITAFATLFLES